MGFSLDLQLVHNWFEGPDKPQVRDFTSSVQSFNHLLLDLVLHFVCQVKRYNSWLKEVPSVFQRRGFAACEEWVLKGLQKCSVKCFHDLFASFLQETNNASLHIQGGRAWGHDNVMQEVQMVMQIALDYYHNLDTSSQWNISKGHKLGVAISNGAVSQSCWNYGKEWYNTHTYPELGMKIELIKIEEYFKKKR